MGEDAAQESYLGDSTICFPQNELGTYYLDCMYTTVLTAYLLPAFWLSFDWTSTWVFLLSCVWLILFFSLLV
ncbi:UNVERIFIED_CONTAM: DNA-binding response regulator, partial [Prevotella sp. 15_C9]